MHPNPSNIDDHWPARRVLVETLMITFSYAILATVIEWLFMSEHSPLNHGDTTGLLFVNLPAFYLYLALFGKQGGETVYFICIFIQWLILGGIIGLTVAVGRRFFRDL